MNQKAYKLYDLENHCTLYSRDVSFYESVFPYSTSVISTHNHPLPIVPLHSDSFLESTSVQEPQSYSEAVQHAKWRNAMQAEINVLEHNHTWRLTSLPEGKRPIGCKWVFKTKLRADGTVERYKAQLVAKGFNQIEAKGWPLHQLDINNAFLHGYLEEDLYMTPPEGYSVPHGSSGHDHCLFAKQTSLGLMALLVYVDDILVTAPSLADIQEVKDYLHSLFTIKDIGIARYFLGLEITRNENGIYVAQTKYVLDIIKYTGLLQGKTASTPFPLGLKLNMDSGATLSNPNSYRRPCEAHWKAALHVVRYLKGCPSKGLFLPSTSNFELKAFCDTDWASCTDARSEYHSMAATVCELRWISYLLTDFAISLRLPIPLFCDNQAALHIMANPVFHERTKHIELDCRVVRDAYKEGFISPLHIRSALQTADLFTKVLSLKVFCSLMSKLGLVSLVLSPTCGGAIENQSTATIVTEEKLKVEDDGCFDAG
ncbi:UNVERIFIED_CONTAM: putative mitochondrial protein [Sesamum latifolium]|uniref:Mitochondrial protein n=1 Tax=Sesamum latifolium TaxID=2727402 RepID=A0AAW2XBT7_9LAMI